MPCNNTNHALNHLHTAYLAYWWTWIKLFASILLHPLQGCAEIQGHQEAVWPGARGHGAGTGEERPGTQEQGARGRRGHTGPHPQPQSLQAPGPGLRTTGEKHPHTRLYYLSYPVGGADTQQLLSPDRHKTLKTPECRKGNSQTCSLNIFLSSLFLAD